MCFMYFKILVLVVCTQAYPLNPDEEDGAIRDLKFVSYVENFKNTMADYVNDEYKYLTVHDKEKVESLLEEFLLNIGQDLTEVVALQEAKKNGTAENGNAVEHEKVKLNDGVSKKTAEQIKATLLTEFPDIKEDEATEIVYRIRLNLLATRQKLDEVIERSKKAIASNS